MPPSPREVAAARPLTEGVFRSNIEYSNFSADSFLPPAGSGFQILPDLLFKKLLGCRKAGTVQIIA